MAFGSLWLPVVLSAITVWLASAIAWMALPHHKSDFRKLPDEAGTMNALRKDHLAPGAYSFPHCTGGAAMKDPAFQEKMKHGPVGILTVVPNGCPNMGKSLGQYLVWTLLVAFLTAYVARQALDAGAASKDVFRLVWTVSFLGYSMAGACDSIWMGRPWVNTLKNFADGAVYAALTGGIFVAFWPAAH